MGWFTTLLELLCIGLIVAGVVGLAFVFWPAAAIVAGVAGILLSREIERRVGA